MRKGAFDSQEKFYYPDRPEFRFCFHAIAPGNWRSSELRGSIVSEEKMLYKEQECTPRFTAVDQ